jgi:predicted DsbA family dithiol-disulfide isomerase
LGFYAQITVHADSERAIALGATRDPAVIANGVLLVDGLPQTEVLESLLRPLLDLPSKATAAITHGL